MPSKPKQPTQGESKALPATANVSAAAARRKHGEIMPGAVYESAVASFVGAEHAGGAREFVKDLLTRMQPRDPAEEMLITQLAFAHARVMRLTTIANDQTSAESIRVIHEYADRASNTYRRLMLALADYRRPPRAGDTFSVVKQTNIAGQQVIQSNEKPDGNVTNEQGSERNDETRPTQAALPADTGRAGVPSFLSSPCEAMDNVHRTEIP